MYGKKYVLILILTSSLIMTSFHSQTATNSAAATTNLSAPPASDASGRHGDATARQTVVTGAMNSTVVSTSK